MSEQVCCQILPRMLYDVAAVWVGKWVGEWLWVEEKNRMSTIIKEHIHVLLYIERTKMWLENQTFHQQSPWLDAALEKYMNMLFNTFVQDTAANADTCRANHCRILADGCHITWMLLHVVPSPVPINNDLDLFTGSEGRIWHVNSFCSRSCNSSNTRVVDLRIWGSHTNNINIQTFSKHSVRK